MDPHRQAHEECRLKWVQENRLPRRMRLPETLGPLAQSLVSSGTLTTGWRRRMRAVLAEHVGPELLDYAEPVSLRGGVLTLEVADPAAMYYLRVRWERTLLKVFEENLPAAGVHTIRFGLRVRGPKPER